MTLYPEQQAFVDLILAGGERIVSLTGKAGAGKTFTLAAMCKALAEQDPECSIVFLAPTHQARGVLKQELADHDVEATCTTIAAYLKKNPITNDAPADVLGLDFGRGRGADPQGPGTVLVVDEASMLDLGDAQLILASNREGTTVFSGDRAQLPPVKGQGIWQTLDATIGAGRASHIELPRNMRAEGPDLADYINAIREHDALPDLPCDAVTIYRDAKAYHDAMLAAVREHGADNVMALAYTNERVDKTNRDIRAALGYPPHWAAHGEILRISAPHQVLDWHEEFDRLQQEEGMDCEDAFKEASRRVKEIQLQTGDLIEVLKAWNACPCEVDASDKTANRQTVQARILTGDLAGTLQHLRLAQLDDLSEVRALLEDCKRNIARVVQGESNTPVLRHLRNEYERRKAEKGEASAKGWMWGRFFFGARDEFCLATSAIGLTTHKAQGSGRRHVFVDWVDPRGPEAAELRYTAVSRARSHLHLYVGDRP